MIRNFKLILTLCISVFFLENGFGQEVKVVDENGEDISFAIIEKVPIYPGCNGEDSRSLKNCMNSNIRKHISTHFNIKKALKGGLKGMQNIFIKFKIMKSGNVKIEEVRAPTKELEKESRRVIKKLPKMIPGEQKGKKVNVSYMLPIKFNVK